MRARVSLAGHSTEGLMDRSILVYLVHHNASFTSAVLPCAGKQGARGSAITADEAGPIM